jgi:phospholipase/carboxylesterase
MMIGRFAIALLAAFALPAAASEPREANDAGFRYLVFEIAGAKPDAALPMIVGLHYSSAKPEAMLKYFDQIDFPARIVLPQGAYTRRDGYSWFPTDYAQLGAAQQDDAVFDAERKLSVFVDAAAAKYATRGKPVVMGISYGGDMAFLLAIRHPDKVRASFPVAARFLPTWMPKTNTCKPSCPPIHAMHGAADTTVPIAPTQQAATRLREMGFDVGFESYPGVAHDFDARMQKNFSEKAKSLLVTQP